jgi:EAL domain-containing protein (putative c-di-GMP-specific phosphodiesterase class I)
MNKEIQLEKTNPRKFKIRDMIQGASVMAHYQPIISLKRKALIGFEGLSRGIDPETQAVVSPLDLFSEASHEGVTLLLDRLCRKKVLEHFKLIHQAYPDMMLTLNFDASVIDQGVVGSGNLIQMVKTMGLNPCNICIEIIESNAENAGELKKFVDTHRKHGFLIALDDVGAGHSNLNRIPLLKPDIIKIDRYLIQNIQDDFYKQQVFKHLIFMCRTLGTQVIAEGVETKAEALMVTQMGADMIQGYYFARPLEPGQCLQETHSDKITDLVLSHRTSEIQKIKNKRIHYTKHHEMIGEIRSHLSKVSVVDFDSKLENLTSRFPHVECFYVLNERGVQVTKTFFNDFKSFHRNRIMFRPAPKETDHSFKDYYYMLMEAGLGKTSYITEPYLSMASGNMCVTISTIFHDDLLEKNLLCVDIKVENLIR